MRIASLPSRAWKWRIASFCAICDPGSPVQADTPFAIVLATSFDQRSPQRLSVTLALSAYETRRHTSCARSVMFPCTSPVR